MSRQVVFSQVDVFSSLPFQGNPLAVVFDGGGLTDRQMLDITRWMNLSETTFVVPAKQPGADYHVRIFTPDGELPFAGHPTLGTAHALLEQGLIEEKQGKVIQECAAGLITVRRQNDQNLAFLAPETVITPSLLR
ncbi:PhzF family phenazine biosynthesis protein [Tatumella ptyseos]|uniref:Trans-2,3-dihydro-3-hydroxyanthranilate isomerase n=1 Tax=Tatumella ptyseos TaxID=82987 RepID=A0A2X5NX58_9GAMM|nr:PhzF family phenazine biosynthesis isomerase [Tatumella ptyseos]SQK77267.1 Trans-2,3-dihydro-3-hydroxyanthranilate isomerase [Tatumella ptyseos]